MRTDTPIAATGVGRRRANRKRIACVLVLASLLASLLLGCATSDMDVATSHPAPKTLVQLLKLRAQGSRDASAYADYFENPELATALAESITETGTAAVPKWKPPYVSAVGTDTVDVIVPWIASDAFPDWPEATAFVMREVGNRWLVIDAVEPADALPGPVAAEKLKSR